MPTLLSYRDLMWDKQTDRQTDTTTITEGSYSYSV